MSKRTPYTVPKEIRFVVFERDNHRCVECGLGWNEGKWLQVGPIVPFSDGGLMTIDNLQTLCSIHYFNQPDEFIDTNLSGRSMFLEMLEIAEAEGDLKQIGFCQLILTIYDRHGVDEYMPWK